MSFGRRARFAEFVCLIHVPFLSFPPLTFRRHNMAPRWPQGCPEMPQDGTKMASGRPKINPRWLHCEGTVSNLKKMYLLHHFVFNAVRVPRAFCRISSSHHLFFLSWGGHCLPIAWVRASPSSCRCVTVLQWIAHVGGMVGA